jgi:dolichol-phosphate mannosyltransferase
MIRKEFMEISIIAPMYNEESNVENTFHQIAGFMENNQIAWELIFVNDGSTDNSLEKANSLKDKRLKIIGYPVNQGRGKALRTGIDYASGDIIVTIDFDLSYDVSHISRMVQTLEREPTVDAVLVSPYMKGGKTIGVTRKRLFFSKLGNLILKHSFAEKINTTTCVVRAYRKKAIKSIMLESNDKEIHLEILTKLLALGYRIKEIPGILTSRKHGNSKSKIMPIVLSHLKFFAFEKPFVIFGFIGILFNIIGFVFGLLLVYRRLVTEIDFGFLAKIISPNVVIIFTFVGLLLVAFGFMGIQINLLRKEIYKLQSKLCEISFKND